MIEESVLTIDHGVNMTEWNPVLYRGNGAWIGIMPDGRIGVGTESEGRASLVDAKFVPMWPYLEQDLSRVLAEFSRWWLKFDKGGVSTPERLMELTVETAWRSGRLYWMQLAAGWVIEMTRRDEFDQILIQSLVSEIVVRGDLPLEIRDRAQDAIG
ncbi:hypothetical protein [Actinophytocola xinjiangensis]|uniref:hypothetical protein n=1 Tax=Actinophytocola xinjiangensis TaxID=485602 RepID=UPI0012B71380|nr:hypothetical protein [Actinophytocola xinjiangensis]